jgi:hypothetical protein
MQKQVMRQTIHENEYIITTTTTTTLSSIWPSGLLWSHSTA